MSERVLVDAANVIGSRPDGWWRDRAGAAARFVAEVRQLPYDLVVVLEGAARAGAAQGVLDRVEVRHAAGSGDDLLAALAGPGVRLVTADRELRRRAQEAGAEVVGPGWLLRQLG